MRTGFTRRGWWTVVAVLVLWVGSAHAGRLGRFVPLASPYGEFTMLAPEGWTFVPGAEENPVIVAPRGRLPPSIAIAVLNATAPLQLQMVRLFLNPTPDLERCFVQAGLSGSYACLGPYYERFEPRMSAATASRVLLTTWQQQGARLLKAIAALGGQTVLRHPSSAELYMAPGDYRYYCLSPSGTVWHTNDELAFRSRCSTPLRRFGP